MSELNRWAVILCPGVNPKHAGMVTNDRKLSRVSFRSMGIYISAFRLEPERKICRTQSAMIVVFRAEFFTESDAIWSRARAVTVRPSLAIASTTMIETEIQRNQQPVQRTGAGARRLLGASRQKYEIHGHV